MFHNRSVLRRSFRGFVLPVLEYRSAVWCSPADIHPKLVDSAVSGARFLTGGMFECDIDNRRSVGVLCMHFKIKCNPVHPLNGSLPGPYVPVRITCWALVAHWYSYAPPRCRTSQYSSVIDLNSMREFKFYLKTSTVFSFENLTQSNLFFFNYKDESVRVNFMLRRQGTPAELINFVQAKRMKAREGLSMVTV